MEVDAGKLSEGKMAPSAAIPFEITNRLRFITIPSNKFWLCDLQNAVLFARLRYR